MSEYEDDGGDFALLAESESGSDNPGERVEGFLAENEGLFAASNSYWKDVREARHALLEDINIAGVIIRRPAPGHRGVPVNQRALHRSAEAQARKTIQQDISIARTSAYYRSRRWAKETDTWSDDAIHAFAKSKDTPEDEARIGELTGLTLTETLARHYMKESFYRTQNLRQLYTLAYIYQEKATREVLKIFEDETVTLPLTERILTLAEDGRGGMHEFPGFLETVALQLHSDNGATLGAAVARAGHDPFRAQFVHEVLTSETERRIPLSPEIAGLAAGVQLLAAALEQSTKTPVENIGELLLRYPDLWPEALHEELHTYTENRLASHRQKIRNAIQPYLQKGRLPSTNMPQINLPDGQVKHQKPTPASVRLAAQQRRRAAHKSNRPSAPEGEDLGGETSPAVRRIGYLRRLGGSGSIFEPVLVESLDELIKRTNIGKYIKKYPVEPQLEATLRACLTSLMEQPLHSHATKQLVDVGFSLRVEQNDKTLRLARKLRRFSLQNLPDIPTGPIANKTRIYYDVPHVEGEYWLLINGVFHKNTLTA